MKQSYIGINNDSETEDEVDKIGEATGKTVAVDADVYEGPAYSDSNEESEDGKGEGGVAKKMKPGIEWGELETSGSDSKDLEDNQYDDINNSNTRSSNLKSVPGDSTTEFSESQSQLQTLSKTHKKRTPGIKKL